MNCIVCLSVWALQVLPSTVFAGKKIIIVAKQRGGKLENLQLFGCNKSKGKSPDQLWTKSCRFVPLCQTFGRLKCPWNVENRKQLQGRYFMLTPICISWVLKAFILTRFWSFVFISLPFAFCLKCCWVSFIFFFYRQSCLQPLAQNFFLCVY